MRTDALARDLVDDTVVAQPALALAPAAPSAAAPVLTHALTDALPDVLTPVRPAPTLTPSPPDTLDPRPLSAWCKAALRDDAELALVAWEMAGRRGLVAHPGASIRVAVALAAAARTGVGTLIAAPAPWAALAWRRALAERYTGDVGWADDGPARLTALTVCTPDGARRHRDALARRFTLVIVDDARDLGGGAVTDLLERATAPWRLGLADAAPRSAAALSRLRRLVGPTAHELTLAELPEVSPCSFDVVVLGVALDAAERAAYDLDAGVLRGALREFFDTSPFASWQDFLRLAPRGHEGQRALGALARMRRLLGQSKAKTELVELLLRRHARERVVVLTPDNASAHAVAKRALVMPITSELSRREREAAIRAFRRGTLRALVSAQGLEARADVPDADVLIVAGGSRGEREHLQRLGRLLRPGAGVRGVVYELVTQQTLEVGQAQRRRHGLETHAHAQL